MITDAFGTPLNVGDTVFSVYPWEKFKGRVIRNDLYDDSVKILWETGARTWTDPRELQSENTDPTPNDQYEYTTPAEVYRKDT